MPIGHLLLRGHNQGVCGSCWAFGSLSALDSRLCIASDGVFQGQLSRGYTASCGTSNGCAGGLSRHTYNLAASSGIPIGGNGGCSPYFARGEGTDHFEQSMPSPPCPDQCHNEGGYARSLSEDRFVLPSIGASQEIWPTNADGNGDAKVSMLNHGPVPFGIYANSALMAYDSGIFSSGCGGNPNHEVVAIGWGDGYFQALNSWGSHWGENGGMRVADCIVTDWTIPTDITQDIDIPKVSTDISEEFTLPKDSKPLATDEDIFVVDFETDISEDIKLPKTDITDDIGLPEITTDIQSDITMPTKAGTGDISYDITIDKTDIPEDITDISSEVDIKTETEIEEPGKIQENIQICKYRTVAYGYSLAHL